MKILLATNLSPAWKSLLTGSGFEALHWSQIGTANAADQVMFGWDHENDAENFTHDIDLVALSALADAQAPRVFQIRTYNIAPQVLGSRAI